MSLSTSNSAANDTIARAFEKHALYSEFVNVKNKLAEKGFVCWVAGGAVRDFLIGREVADFDLVTDATTDQIMQIFPQALTVGASFGVVKLVLKDKSIFDLATFRRESDYVDGRRPLHVDFATPEEDAGRRDFTVNALFWDDQKKQVVDFVNGLQDIERKLLKCVGDPEIRFQEDHLRILRLLRFSIQLGFSSEPITLSAATARVSLLQKISGERILAEFEKMIPYVKWNDFFTQPLAKQILNFLFAENAISEQDLSLNRELRSVTQSIDVDKISGQESLRKFFFVVLVRYVLIKNHWGDGVKAIKNTLKSRLKVGSDDLKVFDSLVFAYQNATLHDESDQPQAHKLTYPQWALEAERNGLILDSLIFLEALQLFDSELLKKLKQTYEAPPPKLVDGNDLLGKVEKEKIGDILKKIRLHQFEEPTLNKAELLKAVGVEEK